MSKRLELYRSEKIRVHQIDHKTHERVDRENLDEHGEVARRDVVKGYEYARNKFIEIDPDELKALRIPTAATMQIKQFVKAMSWHRYTL
jgi:DNA end-binding protein Ku